MSNNKLSYLNKNFDDYKRSLQEYIAEYYPQIANDFNDASIGSWMVDLVALVGDNLTNYIDRAYNETNIDTATQKSSLYSMARTNGVKIPGPKGAMAEVKFSCVVPVPGTSNDKSTLGMPEMDYAPIIKRGTKVSSRSQIFEVMDDIDFSSQFNKFGVSNREKVPIFDSNKNINGYRLTKTEVVVAGESKIYKQEIKASDIVPFMEVVLPDAQVMSVESIIFKDGTNFKNDPSMNEFMKNSESFMKDGAQVFRFFEVDSLTDQYIWGDDDSNKSFTYGYWSDAGNAYIPTTSIVKGKWKPITQKFITEFTDKGYMKITFGSGEIAGQSESYLDDKTDFSQYQISRMVRNNFMGKLPKEGWTMYILYRVGGGAASNVPSGSINNISYLNATIGKISLLCNSDARQKVADVKATFGSVDILINNAGITRDGLLMRMKEEDFDAVIAVNLKGSYNFFRECVPVMIKQKFGRIVSISSIVGLQGNAGQVNYSASKAGVLGITKSVAREYASKNITANAVAPGFVQTPMTDVLPEKVKEQYIASIPLGRFGQVEDIANCVAFLVSDEASYITGQCISVDGGMHM